MIALFLASLASAGPLGPATVGQPPPVSMTCSDVRGTCQQAWSHEGVQGEHWAMVCADGTVGQVGFSAWWSSDTVSSDARHVNVSDDPLQDAFAALRVERDRRFARGWEQLEEGVTLTEAAVVMRRSLTQLTMGAWSYLLLHEQAEGAVKGANIATLVVHTSPECPRPLLN